MLKLQQLTHWTTKHTPYFCCCCHWAFAKPGMPSLPFHSQWNLTDSSWSGSMSTSSGKPFLYPWDRLCLWFSYCLYASICFNKYLPVFYYSTSLLDCELLEDGDQIICDLGFQCPSQGLVQRRQLLNQCLYNLYISTLAEMHMWTNNPHSTR